MDEEKTQGYNDQELLLVAFTKFLSGQIDRSEHIVRGMIRQSIAEWAKDSASSLKEVKHLDENERLRIISMIMDIFLEKIKHIVTIKNQRDKLKQNALLIYDHWKKTRRTDPTVELKAEITQILSEK
jgi:hypothetical protein